MAEDPSKGRDDNLAKTGSVGRPVGSVSIASRRAAKKLESLGFDPIEKMVAIHDQIEEDIRKLTHEYVDGVWLPKAKYSAMAYAQLIAAKQRCVDALMRYGYARAQETHEIASTNIMPMQINLTGTSVDFDTSNLKGASAPGRVIDPDDLPMKGDGEC